jgi:hypothetical protein
MDSQQRKGSQVNHRQQQAKSTSEARVGVFAWLSDRFGFRGSGAPSSAGVGGEPTSPGLTGLTVIAVGLLSVVGLFAVPSASAAFKYTAAGEISGPGPGVSFASLKSESVAVSDFNHHIYVADSGNGKVYDFESIADTSPEVWEGFGGGSVAVAVQNSTGDVYVSDSTDKVINKFEADGTSIISWATGGELTGSPTGPLAEEIKFAPAETGSFGIAVDQATGDLYVIDAGHEVTDVFDPAGAYLEQFTAAPAGLYNNYADGIAVNDKSNELLLSSSQSLETFRFDLATHAFIAAIDGSETPAGNFGTGYTSVAAADASGHIYVNDTEHQVVDGFDSSARYRDQITGALGLNGSFGGLAVDQANGDVYVSDGASQTVKVFSIAVIPDVTTKPATAVTTTSATFNGEVDPEGIAVEECFFEWGKTTTYGRLAPCEAPDAAELGSGSGPVAVHATVSGLPSGVTIHFRLVAKNANGTNNGSRDQSFFSGASIDSTSATEVSATAATLETELNPRGLPTAYHFEYDTAPYIEGGPSHGTQVPFPDASAGSGALDITRKAQVQGLEPLTTYHYRVLATNSLGTSEGPDRSFTTQSPTVAALLPDNRAWEMVTPPNKHGAPLQPLTETGGVIEAAAGGSAFASVANAPLGPESQGSRGPQRSQFLSTRGPGGWSTTDITTPHEEISKLRVGFPSEYQFFSEDLSAGLVEPEGITPLSPLTTERTPYRRESSSHEFVPLVTASNVPAGTKFGGEESEGVGSGHFIHGVEFRTSSPEGAHVVLSSPQILTEEGFRPGFEIDQSKLKDNLYELNGARLSLVSLVPPVGGTACSLDCSAAVEAGLASGVGKENTNLRGALSIDGDRVVFETSESLGQHLYLRDLDAAESIQLDAIQGGEGGAGAPAFQAASADGSRVFFTDESRLTEDSTASPAKPDLYMCEIGVSTGGLACDLSDLSVPINPAESADVQGGGQGTVSAIDTSGTRVYFTADGVLTEAPDAHGEVAHPADCGSEGESACNLYVADTESGMVSLVAVLSSHDDPDWMGRTSLDGLGNLTARSSPNGRWFTFMSTRPLTGYDNRDAGSGQRDAEVFLYDAVNRSLSCVSCNPTGARPLGIFDTSREVLPHLLVDVPSSWRERWLAASIPGWTTNSLGHALYQSRYLSDSGRLFFNSSDALVPQDTNGVMDVYEFELPGVGGCSASISTYSAISGGCVSLISSGTSSGESAFLDASESGKDVFFLTKSRLTTKDVDSAFDVYDASVEGGEPQGVNPPACEGDACQQPAVPPSHPTPGTALLNGPGNVFQCPKGKVKRAGKCVNKQQKKSKKHKKGKKKNSNKKKAEGKKQKSNRTNANRGGAK